MSAESISSLNHHNGLSTHEVENLLEKYGDNTLPEESFPSSFSIFLSQLKNPLVYVLLVAGVVTLFLKEYTDAVIISLAVLVNTVLGFFQEKKASKALEELKKLVHPHARVIRDGEIKVIEAGGIVPGDVVLLSQGDKIPADGELIESNRFFANEAMLTGEAEVVEKSSGEMVYMGTIVTAGQSRMVVKSTGQSTEMGKIAVSVSGVGEDTPLRKQLSKFSGRLSLLVFVLVFLVFVVGLISGENPIEIFSTSVALAVSAIPEGLLVGLTVVLAIGMQRILARKGLVRNLVSAETLGGVTTICVDKTGTLTEGKMRVVNVVGDEQEIAKQVVLANDLDDPVAIASWEWGSEKLDDVERMKGEHPRIDSIPFSSERRMFVCMSKWKEDKNIIFVNGAPEELMNRSALDKSVKAEIVERVEEYSSDGKRILGFAQKIVPGDKMHLVDEDVEEKLEWLGLLVFSDPVRADVKPVLKKTLDAGIRLIVITGDYAKTAIAVLGALGVSIDKESVVLGDDLEGLSNEDIGRKVFGGNKREIKLFARTKPDQKLRIVKVLRSHGEVVAMMGDGVNDAPALSEADIGVVVGEASDVAKESADLVLLDSSFSTVVAAVEEGRGIFDNIRKIILYLMSDAFEEIFIVLLSIVFRFPVPITAAQILWVNIVSDGFPDLALTMESKMPGIMNKPPRSPKEPIVAGWMQKIIAIISITGGIVAFCLFAYVLTSSGDLVLARSVAFATVGVNSLVFVFSVRTLKEPFWKEDIFSNKWLIGAVLVGLICQIVPFTTEGFRTFFGITSIGWYWAAAAVASGVMFLAIEILKWVFRNKI